MPDVQIVEAEPIEEEDSRAFDVIVDDEGNEMVVGSIEEPDTEYDEAEGGEPEVEPDEDDGTEPPEDSSADAGIDPLTQTIEE